MDNCGGGGQRLPPDGDEFPAAYQEFTASSQQQQHHHQQQQQYQYVTSRETMAANGDVDRGESVVDGTIHVAKTSSLSIAELAPEKRVSSNYSVYNTEKSIDVAAYFGQDEDEVGGGSVPPPLPLTGPPNRASDRKFSNGELWRQDNKSEKSVKDKIAMFSSQSSLESPLFPSTIVATATTTTTVSTGRRLSKHKSSDDVFADDNKPRVPMVERTQSSFDLSPTYAKPPPSLPQSSPPTSPTTYSNGYSNATNFLQKSPPDVPAKYIVTSSPAKPIPTATPAYVAAPYVNTSPKSLTRATSFSDRLQTSNEVLTGNTVTPVLARTNSLASTFKRPAGEDARKTSLSQLIEQRRKGISKLRGLVIPEKDAVPIDQPIMDLPEIKSRDSILVNQIPRSNIQDKWGSQSSLVSNASTVSSSVRQSGTFKMPAPKILSSYSPAFKRKSLTVYGNSNSTATSPVKNGGGNNQLASPDAPKSLESICSPTRSDYSFDFVSSSGSPENNQSTTVNSKPKMSHSQRKIGRSELYDDSDNDSAVSSSQSSISRGFSPPMSPVPSDRSTISERSYLSSDPQQPYPTQRSQLIIDNNGTSRGNSLYARSFSMSDKPPAPKPTNTTTTTTTNAVSQIPQRQPLKRSSSNETTSTITSSTSTLSAESLSRRVLKPQSVEAINRKNILASARCRSGRDLNGSPLIQRKFNDDEEDGGDAGEGEKMVNGGYKMVNGNGDATKPQIKIAYIEITENVVGDGEKFATNKEEVMMQPPPRLPPKRSVIPQAKNVPIPTTRPSKPEPLEPSNDMKTWVRAEMRTLASNNVNSVNSFDPRKKSPSLERNGSIANGNSYRSKSSLTLNEPRSQHGEDDVDLPRIRGKQLDDPNDLITVLTTKSRSRSAIHVEDSSYGKLRSPMSLEDILASKSISADNSPSKLPRSQSITSDSRNGGNTFSTTAAPRSVRRSNSTDSWAIEERAASKIPSLGGGSGGSRCKLDCDEVEVGERGKTTGSKIPMARNLGRRSSSVTDMKKVFEKPEMSSSSGTSSPGGQMTGTAAQVTHNRFPSLDSSGVEDNLSLRPTMTSGVGVVETIGVDPERFSGEQFGSISSLASSTSLITQQELAQLLEEATLEEPRGGHDVIVVLLHKENPAGSVGITLAGGVDCETKEITIHRVLSHSIADKEGSVQRGDRILSINGRSMRGLTHRESLAVLKQPRSEVVLVVSRAKLEDGSGGAGGRLRSRTESVETIVEGYETNGVAENTAWGPALMVAVYKDGAGLGFSLEGGRDSPLGDRPLLIKKIFTGGAAEKTGALRAGDQLLEVNKRDVSRMSRIEAWSLMKKLPDGEVNLLVRHPATKSS